MKKYNVLAITISALILIIGLIGAVMDNGGANDRLIDYNNMYGENSYGNMRVFNHGSSFGGMHRGSGFTNYSYDGEKIDVEVLEENVERYISQYSEGLEISDIFIYENSDYYFSITEEGTGRGAIELLVNSYTGDIHPEFGPNMMWNLKYGMHGGRGMMGGYRSTNDYLDEDNELTLEEAHILGNDFVTSKLSKDATLSEGGHEFYGYYTFHIEEDDVTIGMLSVNGYTGDVWHHDWHGELVEIIEGHDDSH